MTTSSRRPVVFLERDRVLVEPVFDDTLGRQRPPVQAEELVLTRWAAMVLRQLGGMGYLCVGIATAGIATAGTATATATATAGTDGGAGSAVPPLRTARIHRRLQEDLGRFGARLDGIWDARAVVRPGGASDAVGAAAGAGDVLADHVAVVQAALLQAIDVHRVDANRSAVVAVSPALVAAGREVGAHTILLRPRGGEPPARQQQQERDREHEHDGHGREQHASVPAAALADFVLPSLQDVVGVVARLRELPVRLRR